MSTGVDTQVADLSTKVQSGTQAVTYIFLILLGLFFVKSGYPALITLEILQLIYLHIFLFTDPLPYLEYKFLDALKYFHFLFLPSPFPSLHLTNPTYSLFSPDVSYLSNSPFLILIAFVAVLYLLVSMLSSKRFINNKALRKTFKKIRKYRFRYNIIHDVFWACYLYAMFISMLQFKMGNFNSPNDILNMMLAIITFLVFGCFTVLMVYLGVKYRKMPKEQIPKKYAFLMLEPSANSLEMPLRYIRKFLFCLGLLLTSVQTQAMVILATNILFLSFFGCYKPAKSPLTNKVVFAL
jgi:hypothetical protein